MRPEIIPADAVSLYRATVRTSGQHPAGYVFPINLQAPLPAVPIPLRPTDQPVPLPLQEMFQSVYADGRYDQTIDYAQPLDPPLAPEDAAWAEPLLRSAGRLP